MSGLEAEIERLGRMIRRAMYTGDMKMYRALEARQDALYQQWEDEQRKLSPEDKKRRY